MQGIKNAAMQYFCRRPSTVSTVAGVVAWLQEGRNPPRVQVVGADHVNGLSAATSCSAGLGQAGLTIAAAMRPDQPT